MSGAQHKRTEKTSERDLHKWINEGTCLFICAIAKAEVADLRFK